MFFVGEICDTFLEDPGKSNILSNLINKSSSSSSYASSTPFETQKFHVSFVCKRHNVVLCVTVKVVDFIEKKHAAGQTGHHFAGISLSHGVFSLVPTGHHVHTIWSRPLVRRRRGLVTHWPEFNTRAAPLS